MRRRAAALAAPFCAVLMAVSASSCSKMPEDWKTPAFVQSSDQEELDHRLPTVTGEVGKEPKVEFPAIKPPKKQLSGVVHKGQSEGALVRSDDILLANMVDYQWTGKGKTKKSQSTYETKTPVLLQLEQMDKKLSKNLVDQPIGTRVVFSFPPPDPQQAQQQGQPPQKGNSVSVVDIKGRYGKGDTVEGEQTSDGGDGLPTVKDNGKSQPSVKVPKGEDAPKKTETEELVKGDGPKIEKGQQVVTQYTGATWKDGKVFDSSWKQGGKPAPFLIGGGQIVKGLDKGLEGKRVGSRVLVAVPEKEAYGKDAAKQGAPEGPLVFVVDLLGAVDQPPAPEGQGDEKDEKDKKDKKDD